jgi:uncharacterized protein
MEDNKTLCRNFLNAICRGDVEGAVSRTTDDFVVHTMGTSLVSGRRDRAQMSELIGLLAKVTVDGIALEFEAMTEEDGRVSIEMTGRSELVSGGSYNNVYHLLAHVRDGKLWLLKEYIDTKYADESLGPAISILTAG